MTAGDADERARVRRLGVAVIVAAAAGLVVALAIAGASTQTVSPRDDCGGFNGHVVWSGGSSPAIQIYGEVWDVHCTNSSTSVWLSWDGPTYHNINAGSATDPKTAGVNYKTTSSRTPTNIKVTVCSTHGSWHCGAGVAVGTAPTSTTTPTSTTPPPSTTPIPSTPVGTTLVPQPPPKSRALRVRVTISWTWRRATTWLRTVKVGSFPGTTRLVVRCQGHGCPKPTTARAKGPRRIHRLLRGLRGRHYRAGDRLVVSLTAPGWSDERAQIQIRRNRLPRIALLRS